LCFTAAPAQRDALAELAEKLGLPLSRAGRIVAAPGLSIRDAEGRELALSHTGFDHFAAA
jgi:thiamine-monophosphate kinase